MISGLNLTNITQCLDEELRLTQIPDYPGAWNGLQLTNTTGRVTKVAAAVDACLPSIQTAVATGADLLLVHHGMFWSGPQMITGSVFQKLKTAMDAGLAIYSSHLPLDVHPNLGNNALLAAACGLQNGVPFGDFKGLAAGLRFAVDLERSAFLDRVQKAVGGGRIHLAPGGPARVRHIGVITGGAGSEVAKVAAAGMDTFLTGEGPHHTYTLAEELGINLIYAGHYATETFGVRALAQFLEEKFQLPWEFIHHPTGL